MPAQADPAPLRCRGGSLRGPAPRRAQASLRWPVGRVASAGLGAGPVRRHAVASPAAAPNDEAAAAGMHRLGAVMRWQWRSGGREAPQRRRSRSKEGRSARTDTPRRPSASRHCGSRPSCERRAHRTGSDPRHHLFDGQTTASRAFDSRTGRRRCRSRRSAVAGSAASRSSAHSHEPADRRVPSPCQAGSPSGLVFVP